MVAEFEAKVGSKGEIYLPQKLRQQLGLTPNKKLRCIITSSGALLLEPVLSIEELLTHEPLIKSSFEEIEKLSERKQREYEEK